MSVLDQILAQIKIEPQVRYCNLIVENDDELENLIFGPYHSRAVLEMHNRAVFSNILKKPGFKRCINEFIYLWVP